MRSISIVIGLVLAAACGSSNGARDAAESEVRVVVAVPGAPRITIDADPLDAWSPAVDGVSSMDSAAALPAFCPSDLPCGGKLAGTWRFTGGCATISSAIVCNPFVQIPMVGTAVFHSDGTFAFDVPAYSVIFKYANNCLRDQGRACSGGSCAPGAEDYCDCALMSNLSDREGGAYAASGTDLSLLSDSIDASSGSFLFDAQAFHYCATDNRLTLVAVPKANGTGVTQVTIAAVKVGE